MSKKWPWLTIGAVAVGGFVAGMVVAQEGDLDFLPAHYSESHTPAPVWMAAASVPAWSLVTTTC